MFRPQMGAKSVLQAIPWAGKPNLDRFGPFLGISTDAVFGRMCSPSNSIVTLDRL